MDKCKKSDTSYLREFEKLGIEDSDNYPKTIPKSSKKKHREASSKREKRTSKESSSKNAESHENNNNSKEKHRREKKHKHKVRLSESSESESETEEDKNNSHSKSRRSSRKRASHDAYKKRQRSKSRGRTQSLINPTLAEYSYISPLARYPIVDSLERSNEPRPGAEEILFSPLTEAEKAKKAADPNWKQKVLKPGPYLDYLVSLNTMT